MCHLRLAAADALVRRAYHFEPLWLVTNLALWGAPLLLGTAIIGSLGLPFPNTLILLAAGALARAGVLDWRLACSARSR